jgi:hypothetical protein
MERCFQINFPPVSNNSNNSCAILNVDVSCLGSPVRFGFSGFTRNTFGQYLIGFSGFIQDSYDILLAELCAIYKGFLLAKDMNIDELVCYSNFLHCVNLIKCPQVRYHIHAVLIQDIKKLLPRPMFLSITHSKRGINVLTSSLNLELPSKLDTVIMNLFILQIYLYCN